MTVRDPARLLRRRPRGLAHARQGALARLLAGTSHPGRPTARPGATVLVGPAIAAILVAGCLPAAATAEGREIGALYAGFVVIAIFVGLLVFGLATFAIVRYRVRGRPEGRRGLTEPAAPGETLPEGSLPPQIRGNTRLELIWTGLPVATVIVLFAFTLIVLNRVEARAPQVGAEVRVEGFRWGWTFRYPNEGIAVSGIGAPGPEVYVPVGEPIRVTLTAADVNHAFFVPRFLFKKDAIPGRDNVFDLRIEEEGAYGGQCAEFCGIYHARMPFTIRAVPRPDYEAWLAQQPREGEGDASVPVGSPLASEAAGEAGSPSPAPTRSGQPLESGT